MADKQDDLAKVLSLNKQVSELYQAGKLKEAILTATEFLELSEKALGPNHPATAQAHNNLARLYHSMGNYAKAEPHYQRVLKIDEKALGPDDPEIALGLDNLALLYRLMGDYAKAEPLYQRALKIYEKALGPDHPTTAKALNNLGLLCKSMGDYAKAEPLFQRAFKIDEKALGPDHPDTGSDLNNLAALYDSQGDYAKAEPLFQRALRIREKALGPDHPDTALALNNLAGLYQSKGDYAKAEPLFQRAFKIDEKALGPDHPDTGSDLNNLAALYRKMGDYAKAEPLFQRALKIYEKALGPDHPTTAKALNNLGLLYKSMGDYAKAEPLYQRALKIHEKALGPDHPDTAAPLSNLAELYDYVGDYAKAEPLFQRALRIRDKALGPDHPDTALALNNLAGLYQSKGDYAKAEPLFQRALRIREKALGPDHPDTAQALNNLAGLYKSLGDYTKAEPLLQGALTIREKALGPDHPDTAQALNNLAGLYESLGDYTKAEPHLKRALKIREKALGPDHPDTALALNNLGGLYYSMGDYAKAEPLFQRALKIDKKALGSDHPATATDLNNLAELYRARWRVQSSPRSTADYAKAEPLLQRALKINEKAFGPDHPTTAKALNNLGLLKIDFGEANDAYLLATRAREAQEKHLSNILSFTSEAQRLAFQKTTNPYTLFATLGNATDLAQTVLRQKGIVLDSLLEDRLVAEASTDPKQREVIAQLRAKKQRLMQLVLEVPKDPSEAAQRLRTAEKEKLSTEVDQLEGGLARQVAGLSRARRALSVTVEQVQSILPKQAVLIELLRYNHYLGKTKFETRYGAVIIPANGEPKWVSLGAAAEIEKDVKLYQKAVGGDEGTLEDVLKSLAERVWAPIEIALPQDTTTVIVSADGELSFVSFATLLSPDNRFLGEKYSIRYVASGRDLLRETKASANPATIIFANPDFDNQAGAQVTGVSPPPVVLRALEMRDWQTIPPFEALDGTATEADYLEKRAWKAVKVFQQADASEANLNRVSSPRVLHLATHGFFLPEVERGKQINPPQQPGEIPETELKNPMHRSGLALAGAQRTRDAWNRGEVPPIENDGIVTAEEVGGLKLEGTWLVVLSACDTGSGEARAGEGVMGLRRGFIQAGAQNLLMTLWPISDQTTTVTIMLDFYDAAERTQNAPEALAEVQRNWLVNLRTQSGLSAAVWLAGAFIMSSYGRPS